MPTKHVQELKVVRSRKRKFHTVPGMDIILAPLGGSGSGGLIFCDWSAEHNDNLADMSDGASSLSSFAAVPSHPASYAAIRSCGPLPSRIPPPPCQWALHANAPAPPANAPPSGKEESRPPEGFFVEESHVSAYFVAATGTTYTIILVMKGKYIMDRSACGLCLNNIAHCMFPICSCRSCLDLGAFKP